MDLKLGILAENIADHPKVIVTYFMPDKKKDGGAYVTEAGDAKKIDDYERVIVLINGATVKIEDILDIECELFEGLE